MQMPKTRYSQSNIFLLLVTPLPMFIIHRGAGNVKAGENKALFNHLCALAAIADSEIPIGSEASDTNSGNDLIQHINMTLSELSWQRIFKKKPGKDNLEEQMPEKFNDNKVWEINWKKWLKEEKEHEADEQQLKLKYIGADKLTAEQRYFLHRRVRILAYAADKIVEELKMLKQEEQNEDAKSAGNLLKTAAYWKEAGKAPPPTASDMFGASCGADVNSCCTNTQAQQASKTLAAVQICLGAAGSTLKDVCVNPQTPLDEWNDGNSNDPTRWSALAQHCGSTATTDKPEELLDTALGALPGSIRKDGSDRYLGAYRTTGCSATQGNGFCIKLTGDSQADPKVLNSLPWFVNIRKVMAALRRSRKAIERAKLLKANLQTLAEQLKVEVDAAKTVIAQANSNKKCTISSGGRK
uniref:Variant surface glycoprotein 1407 n=1 Tax=Trypanosoma brucei TaxID=5691 RepID=M4SVC0_9TRYP|nr:variant surface glycoprotein 1407 [Trypanosoma brucei]